MEHKLILGGEQFLPFARSRIKALKATGLKYASQSFEVDGVSINVKIAGEHEYIRLEGSSVKILSGAIKVGGIVELPVPPEAPAGTAPQKVLRSYKPTQNAWDYPLKKSPSKPVASFNDEGFLAKQNAAWAHPHQYANLSPSMFSGLMAKAVAVIMGRGLEVKYSYTWSKCHGVVLDSLGSPWLVEISQTNGIIAMRLPRDKGSKNSKTDAEKQSVLLFKGVPSGGSFPAPDKLVAALTAGAVLRLATSTALLPFFQKLPYSASMGWSFNQTGSEAHNTCFDSGPPAIGHHYRLNISITDNAEQGVSASAALTLVSQGSIACGSSPILFSDVGSGEVKGLAGWEGTPSVLQMATVLVCHVNDALELIQSGVPPADSDTYIPVPAPSAFTNSRYTTTYAKDGFSRGAPFVSSTTFPSAGAKTASSSVVTSGLLGTYLFTSGNETNIIYGYEEDHWRTQVVGYFARTPLQRAIWSSGNRDSYAIYVGDGTTSSPSLSFSQRVEFVRYGRVFEGEYSSGSGVDGTLWNVIDRGYNANIQYPARESYADVFSVPTGIMPFLTAKALFTSFLQPTVPAKPPNVASVSTATPSSVHVVGPYSKITLPWSFAASKTNTENAWKSFPGNESGFGYECFSSSFGPSENTVFTADITDKTKLRSAGPFQLGVAEPFTEKIKFIGYT